MEKLSDILGQAITLLFQLVLAGILVGLLLGEAAGPLVGSVLANTKSFLSTLNPAAAAVLFVLYLLWRQFGGATKDA
jgi:tryptophan-rich sensory protein